MARRGKDPEPEFSGIHNAVSGSVQGSVVQAENIGTVVMAPAQEISIPQEPRIPHLVPQALRHFVNRTSELDRLGEMLAPTTEEPVRTAVFTGLPGVGKTAIARKAVAATREVMPSAFPGGDLYVDFETLRSGGTTAINDGLADCLRALGVDDKVLPPTLSGRVNLYRARTNSQPLLVVLDDVAEPAEVAPFVPSAPGSAVLVTSNNRLSELKVDGAEVMALDRLSMDYSVELLTHHSGRSNENPAELQELADRCDRLPLVLTTAGVRLGMHRSLTVADFIAEIDSTESSLDAFQLAGCRPTIAAVFAACERNLPADAAALYVKLGLHPGPEFSAELAAAIAGVALPKARRLLEVLLEANFITDNANGRYQLYGLVRRHARGRAAEVLSVEQRRDVLQSIVEFFLYRSAWADLAILGEKRLRVYSLNELLAGVRSPFHAGKVGKADALEWMDQERANLMAVVRSTVEEGWFGQAWQLAEAMTALFVNRRYLEDWVESTRLGVRAAYAADAREAIARLQSFVSRAHTDLGDLAAARKVLDESLPLAEASGNKRLIASVWELYGRLHDVAARCGDEQAAQHAVAAYQRAVELFSTVDDKRGVAFVMFFLGASQVQQGSVRLGLATLDEALALIRAVPDERMAGRTLVAIGLAHAQLGSDERAAEVLDEAIVSFVEGKDFYYEAQSREERARIAGRLGDPQRQRADLSRALEVHVRFGSPRIEELKNALAALG